MSPKTPPPVERLHEALIYVQETGRFFWRARIGSTPEIRRWNTRYAGAETFLTSGTKGYLLSKVDCVGIKAHRTAWAMVHGEWPADQIDHINGDPTDNRICNLRSVSQFENMRNQKAYLKRSNLPPGVNHNGKKFGARLQCNGVSRYIGSFDTPEKAAAAYQAALEEMGFSPRHGR